MNLQFGERLKEERLRLGLKQADLAAQTGIAKKSQTNYELGHSAPGADYLAAIAAVGIDVLYVLTGVPSPALSNDERQLLSRYRSASTELRGAALRVLGVAATSVPAQHSVQISGNQGQVVTGDGIHQDRVTFRVGGGGSKKGEEK